MHKGKIIALLLIVIILTSTSALAFFNPKNIPPGVAHDAVCLKSGCTMEGDINMNNYSIVNATFVNFTFVNSIVANDSLDMNGYNITNVDTLFVDDIIGFNYSVTGPYLYQMFRTFNFNETKLNDTIEQVSGIREYTTTISGNGTHTIPYTITGDIFQIIVTPSTPTTTYRFEAYELNTLTLIDKNRREHEGIWDIRKRSTIVNDNVVFNITDVSAADTFNISMRYKR